MPPIRPRCVQPCTRACESQHACSVLTRASIARPQPSPATGGGRRHLADTSTAVRFPGGSVDVNCAGGTAVQVGGWANVNVNAPGKPCSAKTEAGAGAGAGASASSSAGGTSGASSGSGSGTGSGGGTAANTNVNVDVNADKSKDPNVGVAVDAGPWAQVGVGVQGRR